MPDTLRLPEAAGRAGRAGSHRTRPQQAGRCHWESQHPVVLEPSGPGWATRLRLPVRDTRWLPAGLPRLLETQQHQVARSCLPVQRRPHSGNRAPQGGRSLGQLRQPSRGLSRKRSTYLLFSKHGLIYLKDSERARDFSSSRYSSNGRARLE